MFPGGASTSTLKAEGLILRFRTDLAQHFVWIKQQVLKFIFSNELYSNLSNFDNELLVVESIAII